MDDSVALPPDAAKASNGRSLADALAELNRLGGPVLDALNASSAPFCVTDARSPGLPVVVVNVALATLLGAPAQALIGQESRLLLADVTDGDVVAALESEVVRAGAGAGQVTILRADGSSFPAQLSVTTIRDRDGHPAFHLGVLRDLSSTRGVEILDEQARRSREELRQTRERLRGTQNISGGAGAWEWDIPGGRIIADARFAALYGVEAADAAAGLPAKAFFAPVHPDDLLRLKIAIAGVMNGAEVFSRDYRVVSGDGQVRWVSAKGRAFQDDQDKPVRFAGVLSDVTEQRRAEERLRVAQSAGGIGTFEYLSGYGTVEVSDQFCRLLGLHPAPSLPVRTINALVDPGDGPLIGAWGDPSPEAHSFRIRRADDGQERWLAMRGQHRAHDANGAVSFTGVIYDITEAKLVEERLKVLTESLEENIVERTQERDRLWNLSRDLLFVADSQGRILSVSPAWQSLLGLSEEDLIGALITAQFHHEDAEHARDQLRATAGGGGAADFDCRVRGRSGEWRWFSWTAIADGAVLLGSGRDITQRRILEDQLRQSQKMEVVGQLTGGIAHDFNNMLTGVIGGIEMVRKRLAAGRPQEAERFLEAAAQSGLRAAALTHRLLAFSRRQTLDVRGVDVAGLIGSMTDLLSRTLGEQVALETSLPPDLWLATADANQLENAVLNLAINGRDAMPAGGRLAIGARNTVLGVADLDVAEPAAPGEYVEISVSDTGVGMAPGVLAKVFEPFYTTKPIGHGTGLGLSMIYGFAQQLKGLVRISSLEGQGTTVRLLLPRSGLTADTETRIAVPAPPQGRGETVMVVEDDPAVRLLVVQAMNELGYAVLEAADAPEARSILQTAPDVDMLITDVGLPGGMNGRQLADLVRQQYPQLPVLFVTGYAHQADRDGAFLDVGMHMITKPFAIDDLGRRVAHILGRD